MANEEFARAPEDFQPVRVHQKTVHLVGEDQNLDLHAAGAQFLGQLYRLGERHVAIVVAVNQKNGRAPGLRQS